MEISKENFNAGLKLRIRYIQYLLLIVFHVNNNIVVEQFFVNNFSCSFASHYILSKFMLVNTSSCKLIFKTLVEFPLNHHFKRNIANHGKYARLTNNRLKFLSCLYSYPVMSALGERDLGHSSPSASSFVVVKIVQICSKTSICKTISFAGFS